MFIYSVTNALNKAEIKYALVGGFAVALHGAIRGTIDIDIILALDKKTFIKAEKTLNDLGLIGRLPVSAEQVFDFRMEYIKNKNLIAWSFYHPKHLAQVVDIIITEDVQKIKTVKIQHGTHTFLVASIKDLIRMKSSAGRPQDMEDIKALKKISDANK